MRGSSGIGQLLKGIVMGIILILAIIGSMSIMNQNTISEPTAVETIQQNTNPIKKIEVQAPAISIVSDKLNKELATPNSKTDTNTNTNFQPVLENEKEREVNTTEPVKYGILKVSAINSENKESLMASYVIYDHKNIKIAESNDTRNASYRLPVGNYNIVTTLSTNNKSGRSTSPVQSTNIVTINAQKLSNKVIELEPPPTIGVLQVSAVNAKNKQSLKANFIVQRENGETVASRQNVTNSLFKLKAGSYKVTVKSGINSDFRTIVVEPGESTTEVFKLHEAFLQGKVSVHIFDKRTNNALQADVEISAENGQVMQVLTKVVQTEIALIAGNYKVKVTGSKDESTKNITVIAGQPSQHIFRLNGPTETNPSSVIINENVKISAIKPEVKDVTKSLDISKNSTLNIFAKNETGEKPIKSNFYIQTLNGRHIAKKTYANSAQFKLKAGKYRVTVRANGKLNVVRNIQINANQKLSETFLLKDSASQVTSQNTTTNKQSSIPNGFLNVVMQPVTRTHFIIMDNKRNKVVELTSVPSGKFKLDIGVYTVTAILNGQRRNKTTQVRQNKTTNLIFNAKNFQAPSNNPPISAIKGLLKSRIIDATGKPLKGNLTVKNNRNQLVANAKNVTFGVFELPPDTYTIKVNYNGLSGSELIHVSTGKTTMQTFTISPNDPVHSQPATSRNKRPQNAKELLRKKLEEELRRVF